MTPYETPSEIIALNILQNVEFKQSYADQTFQTNKTIFALITQKCHEMAMINYTRYGLLHKIRPIIDTFNSKSHFQLSAPTENLCIDEQMVPFKAHSRLKQYNPQEPKK